MLKEKDVWWQIPFMEFVDDFRRAKEPALIAEPLERSNHRFDQLMASTIEYLCQEQNLEEPEWTADIEPLDTFWFVSEMDPLRAIATVESPAELRTRHIFVLENFLSRA